MKVIFEGQLIPEYEDSRMAMITELDDAITPTDGCIFVKVQSWDDNKKHTTLSQFLNSKVRITVETVS